ncbi:sugar phosphate isomerase/epimerase family protein [Enterococcus nangangensis]|uniref:sugar phosphate isomerase/epimerase family protein n=1 Tax=Enterococcus nangangensis TaxID=2559926 RepID=UPI0010F5D327|nr:sugar phosphate isomerase/epimerase family protein [Enterococcus nangangensis]
MSDKTFYNLGARGHDITTAAGFEDLAAKLASQRMPNVQLALGKSFPNLPTEGANLSPGFGTYVKNILGQKNIQVAILSCYINMIHPDEAVRDELLSKFEAYVKYARYFGAPMVASETGGVFPEIKYTEENFTPAAFAKVVSSVKRLAQAGEKYQTFIGVEPGRNHPIYSLSKMQELLTKVNSDYVGVVLDPTNLISGETYLEQVTLVEKAFAMFGDKIIAFHLKDFVVTETGGIKPVNFGDGVMKRDEILKIIARHKPYLPIILEETKDDALGNAMATVNG